MNNYSRKGVLEEWKGSIPMAAHYETYYHLDTVKSFTVSYKIGI